jgi:hypothetical protein
VTGEFDYHQVTKPGECHARTVIQNRRSRTVAQGYRRRKDRSFRAPSGIRRARDHLLGRQWLHGSARLVFFTSLPKSIVAQNAVMFTPEGKVRLDRVSQEEFKSKLREDARFLRLEGLSAPMETRPPSRQLDPTFIVWSRLARRGIGRLGVYADTSEFHNLFANLVYLIRDTLPGNPRLDTVSEYLRLIGRRLLEVGEPA